MSTDTRPNLRETSIGKLPLEHNPECASYARLVDRIGVRVSLHEAAGSPGLYWLASANERGDYRPARLDVAQVQALRDACDLVLADHLPVPVTVTDSTPNRGPDDEEE